MRCVDWTLLNVGRSPSRRLHVLRSWPLLTSCLIRNVGVKQLCSDQLTNQLLPQWIVPFEPFAPGCASASCCDFLLVKRSRFHLCISLLPAASHSNSIDFLEIKRESENRLRERGGASLARSRFRTPFKYWLTSAETHPCNPLSHLNQSSSPELTRRCCHTLWLLLCFWFLCRQIRRPGGSEQQREAPVKDVSPRNQSLEMWWGYSFSREIFFLKSNFIIRTWRNSSVEGVLRCVWLHVYCGAEIPTELGWAVSPLACNTAVCL